MQSRLITNLFAAILLSVSASSCDRAKQGEDPSGGIGQSSSFGGGAFLRNRNVEFNRWLDEAVAVEYRHMPPHLIFDQVPLKDVRYEIVSLPVGAPNFNFSNPNITRRDLLHAISQHWSLRMSLVTQRGKPVAVRVEG